MLVTWIKRECLKVLTLNDVNLVYHRPTATVPAGPYRALSLYHAVATPVLCSI